ncbi:MAG: WYL domain-containing protein [Bacteroidota bacterium]
MPLTKSAAIRYRIIDACLTNKQKPFPSLENLARICSEKLEKEISQSTIEKDISSMKRSRPYGFDAHIIYSKERKGYAYGDPNFSISDLKLEDEEWESLRYAAKLLYQYSDVPIFKDFKQAIEKIDARFRLQLDVEDEALQNYIQFDTSNATTGYEWLGQIFKAVQSRWLLNIRYENIYKNEIKNYDVVPYLLKENRNRWYVIAWVEERNDYLTFALDRIIHIAVVQERQKFRSDFNSDLFLKHSVGIMKNEGTPSKIILSIKDPYQKLVQLEPIHASQKTIKITKERIQIELSVYINHEFCNRIISMSSYCKVIQPLSLKKTIILMLGDALKQYK